MTYTRPYPPPDGADVGLDRTRAGALPSPCDCQDPDHDRLVELVACGLDQWTANREIWGAA